MLQLNKANLFESLIRIQEGKELYLQRNPSGNAYKKHFFQHIINSVPFYQQYFSGKEYKVHESSFPIVRRSDLAKAEMFLSKDFDPDHLVSRTTSGTSGIPLTISRDKASLYAFLHHGYSRVVASMPEQVMKALEPGKIGVVLVDDLSSATSFENINPSLNYSVVKRVSLGRGDEFDRELVEGLRSMTVPILYGRPRSLERLRYTDAMTGGGKISPLAVLASGDNLYSEIKSRLKNWFGCNVYNSYALQECGFTGIECAHEKGIHLFTDIMSVQVMDKNEKLTKTGTGHLVITCFDNWVQPIINYRTDDWVTVEKHKCNCGFSGYTITAIEGRNSPYFYFDGKPFNPSHFNKTFEDLPLFQFEMVQRGENFTLRVVPHRGAENSIEVSAIETQLKKIAPIREISIEICSELNPDKNKKVQRYQYFAS